MPDQKTYFSYYSILSRPTRKPENWITPDLPSEIVQKRSLDQIQSPLFGTVPAEIRNQIFDLAFTRTPLTAEAYQKREYFYRPGYTCPIRLYTDLLRTCRRVYLEAWWVPISNAEIDFWFGEDVHLPPGAKNPKLLDAIVSPTLTPFLNHVHLFAPTNFLQGATRFRREFDPDALRHLRPKSFTITVRHEDWHAWFHDPAPTLERAWLEAHAWPSSVRRVALELETLDGAQTEAQLRRLLDAIADPLAPWTCTREDGRPLPLAEVRMPCLRWERPAPTRWLGIARKPPIRYVVAEITWVVATGEWGVSR